MQELNQARSLLAQYRRASVFLRPYWLRFVPLFALSTVSTALSLIQPYFTKLLIDEGLQRRDFHRLLLFAIWMAVSATASFALGILTTYLYTRLSALVLFDIRLQLFHKLQRLSPQFFAATRTGDIVSRLNNDVGELQRISADTLLSLPSNLLFLVGNAALMLYLSPGLALLSLIFLPFGIWAMTRYQGRLRSQIQIMRESSADIGSFLIEAILGIRLLVSSNAQARKDKEFSQLNNRFVDGLLKMQTISALAGALPGIVLTLSVAAIFLYGGYLVIAGVLSIGGLMAFMAYHSRLLSPVQSLMGTYSALVTGSVSVARVFELLDQNEEVQERASVLPNRLVGHSLEFRDVSFRYPNRAEIPVLQEVSFRVPERQISVLIGTSGSGKSTITDLLHRFYDPDVGSVLIDGCDIRDLRLHDLREAIAVVEQTPFFFHTSIRDNLLFAAPEASLDNCRDAVARAGLGSFIDLLPDGYNTVIGERGLTLSAGQRQRLAIARTLLRRPSILILDEPTAALDGEAERSLAITLQSLASVTTLLIATHRPAIMEIADQVLTLRNGRVTALSQSALVVS